MKLQKFDPIGMIQVTRFLYVLMMEYDSNEIQEGATVSVSIARIEARSRLLNRTLITKCETVALQHQKSTDNEYPCVEASYQKHTSLMPIFRRLKAKSLILSSHRIFQHWNCPVSFGRKHSGTTRLGRICSGKSLSLQNSVVHNRQNAFLLDQV